MPWNFLLSVFRDLPLSKWDNEGYLLDIIEKPSEDEVEEYRDTDGKLRVSMNAFKFDGQKMHQYLKDCPVHPGTKRKGVTHGTAQYAQRLFKNGNWNSIF